MTSAPEEQTDGQKTDEDYIVPVMFHRWLVVLWFGVVPPLAAQDWNDAGAQALVARAVEVRRHAVADSTLVSYSARAHGVVTFRAELGSGALASARLIKGDELAVEVYWQRPDRSKQVIQAWRDTTLFPNDLGYHRDHLGIVSDDFGSVIRIGEGDEVADVVHPLAPEGFPLYDFRIGDTVRIATPSGRVVLVALEFRPKDRSAPRAVGTLYLDLDRAVVVRSSLSFTRAAYRDRDLEDIAVRLERALVEGRYWLPYLQQIEIRRRSALIDFPLRGVIRGQWEIGDYRINEVPAGVAWSGPAIAGLTRTGGPPWPAPIAATLDSSTRTVDRRDLALVRAAVAREIRQRVVDGLPRGRLDLSRASDLLRVNRVEGLRIGGGIGWRAGPLDRIAVRAGVATADGRLTGGIDLGRVVGSALVTATAERAVVDVGDAPATSLLINSLAAQEGGRDLGDYVEIRRAGIGVRWANGSETAFEAGIDREWSESLVTRATPAQGRYPANPPLASPPYWVTRFAVGRTVNRVVGTSWSVRIASEGGAGPSGYGRVSLEGEAKVPAPGGQLGVRGFIGLATADVPGRRSFSFGGIGTLTGEAFRGYGGRRVGWVTAEWLADLPGPSLPLGIFGRTSPGMAVGPVFGVGAAGAAVDGLPWGSSVGLRPVIGLAAELFERVVRIEIGQRLRGPGGPTLNVDVTRHWWPIL